MLGNRIDKPYLIREGLVLGTQPKADSHKLPWFNPRLSSTQLKLVWYWGTEEGLHKQQPSLTILLRKMMLAVPPMSSPPPQLPQSEGIASTSFLSWSV